MYHSWLNTFRHRLADANSLIHLSLLGVLSGFGSALIILLFRLLIDTASSSFLPNNNTENFEALPSWLHFSLPFAGAIIMGLVIRKINPDNIKVGMVHVITRLHGHHGHFPMKNALVQFFGGAFAIITGQSGGREGPAIHLGAAANSLLGRSLQLPNNSMRILVGCGTSAAIAASFDTPIAGVIFAMEVIMLEYTVSSFIPVMLATVTATVLTHALYGNEVLFSIPPLGNTPLWELPYIAMMGLIIGSLAALFIVIIKWGMRYTDRPVLSRFALAGLLTGVCALMVPEVLGLGYDSLNAALAGEIALPLLLALIMTKLITTSFSISLGLPVGLIGPNLLIGACVGSAMGTLGAIFYPAAADHHSFYVLLGMGSMMGAVLNAPLAALMALMELSNTTAIIFPGMLAITIATLTTSEIFKQRSAHQTILNMMKHTLPTDPMSLALQRASVASIMHPEVTTISTQLQPEEAKQLIHSHYNYFVIDDDTLLLAHRCHLHPALNKALEAPTINSINLNELNIDTQPLVKLYIQATLWEALSTMNQHQVDAVYIVGNNKQQQGIVTRKSLETHYHITKI